jgi:predicted ATPase
MTHSLSFSRVHKSITSLDEITLPKFVVLTGVNGSGKTHLLTAIKGGEINSTLVSDINSDVRLFDSTNIVPTDTGSFDPFHDQSKRGQWFQTLKNQRDQYFPGLQSFALSHEIPGKLCSSIEKISALSQSDLTDIFSDPAKGENVWNLLQVQVRQMGNSVASNTFNQIGDDYWRKNAQLLAQTSPELFMSSTRTEFFRNSNFLWGDVDPFQQAFGQVFVTYRTLIHDNDRLEKYPPPGNHNEKFLSGVDFIDEYGPPPWDFVNQILEESNLSFRVDSPPLHETGAYEPKLRKASHDIEMGFQDLSSGEKVLMSFALCLYNSREGRQAKKFPRLLLLDEVDAPLHPSMTVSLLNTIQNVLVNDRNVCVIMTTHSPSTVALAPEDSIYAMDPSGPRLVKTTKGNALSLLTAGVPTLSISFSGRRQVFVESRTDASLYDSLYQKYKPKLNSERSLAFVEVGRTNGEGVEQSGGCEQVSRLVTTLNEYGNQSVLGLVDWDGRQKSTTRIHVLAVGIRDGLESLLFDPALMVALVIRENSKFAVEKNIIEASEPYVSIMNWDTDRWQRAVNTVQNLILADEMDANEEITEIEYLSGLRLNVRTSYLQMDDHKLETLITTTFGFLKPRNKRTGELMRHMVDTVLADFDTLLPKDLLTTFQGLLKVQLE